MGDRHNRPPGTWNARHYNTWQSAQPIPQATWQWVYMQKGEEPYLALNPCASFQRLNGSATWRIGLPGRVPGEQTSLNRIPGARRMAPQTAYLAKNIPQLRTWRVPGARKSAPPNGLPGDRQVCVPHGRYLAKIGLPGRVPGAKTSPMERTWRSVVGRGQLADLL